MQHYLQTCLLLLLLSSFICQAGTNLPAEDITVKVVTEESYPIQFFENGKLIGTATTFVEQVLAAANIQYNIDVYPWARAYRMALNEPNILIFSLAKTAQRADKFKWVGEIMDLEYYLFGPVNSNINAHTSLEELRQYRIGTVRDGAPYQYLLRNDFKNLVTVVKAEQTALLYQSGRIDLLPANKSTFEIVCRNRKLDCSNLVPLYKLDMPSIKLFMAFSQLTDDFIVEKVRAAYNQVTKAQHNLIEQSIN
ncbi:substrate-binding periplasmic protein [Thalassotalea piscium]|uniref:Polar amino acid transport system substrate-binding protein n=1 Tax=Thalassotalea piscium TaxID=1230533 RepID=A0A7X0NFN6_9GAMM|nr:transporter substrate-binding domain-containing protein [Thalassotalea piscium]MBB6542602.1 polar amino acid transport system substrate-binding protein [Thalassotalea piscium]